MDAIADPTGVLLARLQDLGPLVARHRAAIEAEGRLPPDLFAALAEAGLFRLWLPRALGGPELSPLDFMEVVEAAAALDASVGWIVGNGGGASRIAGYLPEGVARDLLADRHAFVVLATGATGVATPTADGFRVTGRWPYGSGIHGATAVAGLCTLPGAEAGRMMMAVAPIAAVTVHETWDVSGLRGTGSCDFALEDAAVGAGHVFFYPDQVATQPGIVYRLPIVSSFTWSVSVVPLGIARALLADVAAIARGRTRLGTAAPLAEREYVQMEIGRAEAAIRAARAFLREAMSELMEAVEAGVPDLIPARAALRLAAAQAAEAALGSAARLESLIGALAIQEAAPIARRLRDLRAAVQHIAMSPNNFILGGRVRLGLEPGTTRV
jgi:alkylation response protein AidB-like acyl-CoA dehydrogenase